MWATVAVMLVLLVVGITFAIKLPMFATLFEAWRDIMRDIRRQWGATSRH